KRTVSVGRISRANRFSDFQENGIQEEEHVVTWITGASNGCFTRANGETRERGEGVEALAVRPDGGATSRHDGDPAFTRDCDRLRGAAGLRSDFGDHRRIYLPLSRRR